MTHDALFRCTVQKSEHARLGHLIVHVNKATAATGNMFHFDKVEEVHQRVLIGGGPSHWTAAAAGRLSLRFRRREHVIRVARTVVEISARRQKSFRPAGRQEKGERALLSGYATEKGSNSNQDHEGLKSTV
jgi:hypothetical protein